jgi:hypothetical protein
LRGEASISGGFHEHIGVGLCIVEGHQNLFLFEPHVYLGDTRIFRVPSLPLLGTGTGHAGNIQGYGSGRRPSRSGQYKRSKNGSKQGFRVLHINSSLVELVKEFCDVRINERNDNEYGNDHEHSFVNATRPGNGANLTCLASLCGLKDAPTCKKSATSAAAIKNGRYGSSRVRFPIHAPLNPRATRTRGPRQQVEAKMAAKPPAKSAPEPLRSEALPLDSTLTCRPAGQRQPQLVLQLLQVGEFALDIGQLLFQTVPHGRTRLLAIPSQPQETSNLAEFESQTMYAAYEGQRLNVVFAVLAEGSLGSRRSRQQGIAFVEPNRVNAETDPFRNGANLH